MLPFLLGSELVGRVDLKSDRRASTLLVQAAWREPGVPEDEVAAELLVELRELADWLGLEKVVVIERGDLAATLGRINRRPSPPTRRSAVTTVRATTG